MQPWKVEQVICTLLCPQATRGLGLIKTGVLGALSRQGKP
jgi:hypothetical protein